MLMLETRFVGKNNRMVITLKLDICQKFFQEQILGNEPILSARGGTKIIGNVLKSQSSNSTDHIVTYKFRVVGDLRIVS